MPGLSMRAALKNGQLVYAKDLDRHPGPEANARNGFLCAGRCGQDVKPVTGYTCKSSRKVVSAHFRLPPGKDHNKECLYDVPIRLDDFARKAAKLNTLSGKTLIEKLKENEYVVRLNLLEGSIAKVTPPPLAPGDQKPIGRGFQRSGRNLAPYVTLASELVRLYVQLNAILMPGEWEELVTLEIRGQRIPWSQFLFDELSRGDLYENTSIWSRGQLVRPIALVVTPRRTSVWRQPPGMEYDCTSCEIERVSYGVKLFTDDNGTFARIEAESSYLVIATQGWKFDRVRGKIGLVVSSRQQIARIP